MKAQQIEATLPQVKADRLSTVQENCDGQETALF